MTRHRPRSRTLVAGSLVTLAALALLPAPAAVAAPANSALFEDLAGVVDDRLQGPLAGDQTGDAKKQQKAANVALKLLRKDSTKLSKDLKLARGAVKELEKRFPNEFTGATGFAPVAVQLVDALEVVVQGAEDAARVRRDDAEGKLGAQLDKLLGKVDEAQAAADAAATLSDRAKQLSKAAKLLEKAHKKASKKRTGSYLFATVDGVQLFATNVQAQRDVGSGETTLGGTGARPDGTEVTVFLSLTNPEGKGPTPVADAGVELLPAGEAGDLRGLNAGSATVELRRVDLDAPWLEGTLAFTATSGTGTSNVTDGSFGIDSFGEPTGGGNDEIAMSFDVDSRATEMSAEAIFVSFDPGVQELQIEGQLLTNQGPVEGREHRDRRHYRGRHVHRRRGAGERVLLHSGQPVPGDVRDSRGDGARRRRRHGRGNVLAQRDGRLRLVRDHERHVHDERPADAGPVAAR